MAEQMVATQKQVDDMLEEIRVKGEQIDTLIKLAGNVGTPEAPKTNGRGGRKVAQPVLDTKTGIAYRTKSAAGIAVAPEFKLTPHNFVWYELVKGTKEKPAKCPNRFEGITNERYLEITAKAEKTAAEKK